jgi:tRNA pseudouridine55 synthase
MSDPRGRKPRRDVNGWLVLDKPEGLTSTRAVAIAKRLFQAAKVGHAGTLDPLATGLLPLAFGEATKTVPYIMEGEKLYRFTMRFGAETNTDDSEGEVVETSGVRPETSAIETALARFTGTILQVPPRFSAIKVEGARAYDLARGGEAVELAARPIDVHALSLVERPDPDHAVLEAECGKGTYVRALARDLGRMLGTRAHVSALRRLAVGPFEEEDAVPLAALEQAGEAGADALDALLLPVGRALEDLPSLAVSRDDAARLRRGQAVILRGRDAPVISGEAVAQEAGQPVAIGEVAQGAFHPRRILHLAPQARRAAGTLSFAPKSVT